MITQSTLNNIHWIQQHPTLGQSLIATTTQFRTRLNALGIPTLGQSHIIPILFPNNHSITTATQTLQEKGFWTTPIRHPTVPKHEPRLRITIQLPHTEQILNQFLEALKELSWT